LLVVVLLVLLQQLLLLLQLWAVVAEVVEFQVLQTALVQTQAFLTQERLLLRIMAQALEALPTAVAGVVLPVVLQQQVILVEQEFQVVGVVVR